MLWQDFSGDVGLAFKALERFAEDRSDFTLLYHCGEPDGRLGYWHAHFPGLPAAVTETVPLAICRALLLRTLET